jgi:hypothetical protein
MGLVMQTGGRMTASSLTQTHKFTSTTFQFILIIAIIVALFPASGNAFDGNRKGFVLGLGLGYAPIVRVSSPHIGFDSDQSGEAMDLLIGYAWNNQNILFLSDEGSAMSTDGSASEVSIHVIGSVKWNHYYGIRKHPFFTSIGLGIIQFGTKYSDVDGGGFGYTIGAGKEIFKQVQVGIQYYGGWTSNSYGVHATHSALNFLVTVIAY